MSKGIKTSCIEHFCVCFWW